MALWLEHLLTKQRWTSSIGHENLALIPYEPIYFVSYTGLFLALFAYFYRSSRWIPHGDLLNSAILGNGVASFILIIYIVIVPEALNLPAPFVDPATIISVIIAFIDGVVLSKKLGQVPTETRESGTTNVQDASV